MKALLFFVGLLTCCGALVAETPANANATADPNAWSIRTYRLLAQEQSWPALPAANAEWKDIELFLRAGHEQAMKYLVSECGVALPEGSLAAYDAANRTLVVRTVNAMQDVIGTFMQLRRINIPQYMSFTTHVVEADGALLRTLIVDASKHRDHSELWQRMQTFVEVGRARELETLHEDTRSGQRVNLGRVKPRTSSLRFSIGEKGLTAVDQQKRDVGTQIEIDPVLGPDSRTVDANFCLSHHYAPPTDRWPVILQDSTRRIEGQVTDYHTARVLTSITTMGGSARLIGVWKPDGVTELERADHLQAAFLTTDVVVLLPVENDRLLQLVKANGEKIVSTPPPVRPGFGDQPAMVPGMITRTWRVPPDFLTSTGGVAIRADPFPAGGKPAPPPGPAAARQTAMDILKAAGVDFPPGSMAIFDVKTFTLVVHNLPKNLDTIESYVDDLHQMPPRNLACTFHIVQADAKTLRDLVAQTRQLADHTAAWHVLEEAAAQGRAKIVSTSWFETRSGQRAVLEAGTEYMTATSPEFEASKAARSVDPKNPGALPPSTVPASNLDVPLAMTHVGVSWQVEPVLGPDGETLDVGVEAHCHFAAPTVKNDVPPGDNKVLRVSAPTTEFHFAKFETNVTLLSGSMRLLGVWKPEGAPELEKEDVLQAAFLKMDVVPVGR